MLYWTRCAGRHAIAFPPFDDDDDDACDDVRSQSSAASSIFDEVADVAGAPTPARSPRSPGPPSPASFRSLPSDDWGQFERNPTPPFAPPPRLLPPEYVLEASLDDQRLWRRTAGRRAEQPKSERAHIEAQWRKNFESSEASAAGPAAAEAARAPAAANAPDTSAGGGDVAWRARSALGTSAQRSWECDICGAQSAASFSVPKYQVRESVAEFLVVARVDGLTFGVWRRFSAFRVLARALEALDARFHGDFDVDFDFTNALRSWKIIRRRQRWIRCLDAGYLGLKCFLLERFLHDALFEAPGISHFADFLGIRAAP